MRYDSKPAMISVSPQDLNVSIPEGINLDLSSRKKIVIQPSMSRKESTLGRPGVAVKTLVLGNSIFNRAQPKLTGSSKASPVPQLQEPSKVEHKVKSISHRNATSRPSKKDRMSERPREAKSTNTKQDMIPGILDTEYRMNLDTIPPRITVPEAIVPNQVTRSPYSEEYTKCGCVVNDQPACPRCQFLQLTERFCNSVNMQHQKWNIPQ